MTQQGWDPGPWGRAQLLLLWLCVGLRQEQEGGGFSARLSGVLHQKLTAFSAQINLSNLLEIFLILSRK